MKNKIRHSNQHRHKNAKIIYPKNPKDPLVIEAVAGSDFELDLKDPQIRHYFKDGKLNFVIKGTLQTTTIKGASQTTTQKN